ncbi:MAG: cytochrome c [Candidatus Kapaibacterium sp.]
MQEVAIAIILPLFLFIAIVGCSDDAGETGKSNGETNGVTEQNGLGGPEGDMVKRGEYLVTVLGCNDCHTPKIMGPQGPEPDPARLMSGHPAGEPLPAHDPNLIGMGPDKWILANMHFSAYVGPWGTTYASNLTPDETGIGSWTEEQFLKAIKQGLKTGGARPLMPPMPWQGYSKLSDGDLKAIFAYLKSLPPISNAVPEAQLAGPPPGATPGGEAPAEGAHSDSGAQGKTEGA